MSEKKATRTRKIITPTLKFSQAKDQSKLQHIADWLGYIPDIWSFSLPSGYACPFALICLSKADKVTGKITDGKHTTVRCFSATMEAYQPSVRAQRWHNFDTLRHMSEDEMVPALLESLPRKMTLCRIHVGGDFFSASYFRAWARVAMLSPTVTFYAYTKSIPYWVDNIDLVPPNLILNGSRGGRRDDLLDTHDLKTAEIVFSLTEAEEKGLEIDHDESHAIRGLNDFALLVHGTQPKGSKASDAIKTLKRDGVEFAYSRK